MTVRKPEKRSGSSSAAAAGAGLRCIFFRTLSGNEPVREWLRDHISAEARKTIGTDIRTVQATWPIGSTLESLFEELGELEEIKARAAKKILAIQAERRMKELGLSTTGLASRMGTSRNQIHRILDREDAGITLKMLFRLAAALSMPLTVTFGADATTSAKKGQTPPHGPAKAPPKTAAASSEGTAVSKTSGRAQAGARRARSA